jgi:hypothetical protein
LHVKAILQQLQTAREKARDLPSSRAVVAWFGGRATHSDFVPIDKLSVVVLVKGHRTHLYYEGKKDGESVRERKTPVLVASAPAIMDGGVVTLGAVGWFRYVRNRCVQYTRDEFRGAKPVGVVRDLLCREFKNSLALVLSRDHPDYSIHQQLARRAIRALENVDLSKRSSGANQSVLVPTLLAARQKTPLRIRIGPELEQWAIHCACTGRWRIPGTVEEVGDTAPQTDGEVTVLKNGDIKFKGSEYEDTHEARLASRAFMKKIDKVFGETNVAVPCVPLIETGRTKSVKLGEPLYGPVQKKEWTEEEFRALPEDVRMTCFYLAAISAGRVIDNFDYLDTSMTIGGSMPVADLGSVPAVQTVSNSSRGLDYRGAGVTVTLMRFIKHHMDLHRQLRKEQRQKGNAKPHAKKEEVEANGKILEQEQEVQYQQAHA